MIKLSSPKESICFNFENEDQRRFFDKAKKCDIIKNNNSVFLRKILSVKNQSLLNETLKQSKSQIFNHINTSTYNNNNVNINNSSSNLTLIQNKIDDSFNPILSPRICLDDNFNNSFKIEVSPKKVFSPKIVVNKNKNLRINIQKEKENDINKENIKELPLCTETIITEKDNTILDIQKNLGQKVKYKYSLNTINTDCNIINPEMSFSNLYTKNYMRKPVVIKFKNGFNCSNIKNKNIINDKKDLSQEENKENIPNNNQVLKKVKTESKIKPYNFYRKSDVQPELYRSFEDLERKSLEITKRKKKSNPICSITSFKKENNLMELKESLENYRQKTKSNLKRKRRKKAKIFNNMNNNSKNIKSEIAKIKNNNMNFGTNNQQNNKIEEYNSFIKKDDSNNHKNSHWHRQKSLQFNNINLSDINENKIIINRNRKSDLIPKVRSEELLINNHNYENIKKKSIKINFIEESKTENIYNITLNTNNVTEAFNRFHISLNHAQDFNYKNYIIRQKYGKKHNIYENHTYQDKEKNKLKKKKINNNSLINNKKFVEDNKTNENINELMHYQSLSLLAQNKKEKQIKVNKKNINGKKLISINSCQQNINSILDLEDKINKEINIHLNIINGIEIMSGIFSSYQKKLLKEIFFLFCNYYDQIRMINNTTLISNMSQLSDLKYIKKIVQKRGNNQLSKRIFRNKSFNAEKQKILLIKRKEFGFLEKYENCLDFINKLRFLLIKYSASKNI